MSTFLKILMVVFLCSSSSLAYEIVLTRIFSISLSYHFAFIVISIAMLGIGMSGTALSLVSKLKTLSNIGLYCFLLGVGISLSYLVANQIPFDPVKLSWSQIQLLYMGIYYILLSIPFFFTGLIIAVTFSLFSEKSGLVYGADLLGAGIGALGVLLLMNFAGPDTTIIIVSCIALSAAFIAGGKLLRAISVSLILIYSALLFFQFPFLTPRMSSYKGLNVALRYPGAEHIKTYYSSYSRIDTFRSPAVRFAPGLSLKYLNMLPEQLGFSIDGGEINAITSSGRKIYPEFLRYLPSALPYEINKPKDVLILDPKGGLQSLVAEYYGALRVYQIESNPFLVEIIQRDYRKFSGGIYSQNTWGGLARSWLKKRDSRFDIIDISMMGTMPSGSFGISEDYRFTVDAFKEYINHLTHDGIMSINLYILPPPRIELRLLLTIISAMEEVTIKESERHVAAIRSWGSICILMKRSPFTSRDIEAIKTFSRVRNFDLVYYPGIREEETNLYVRMPSDKYFAAFQHIIYPDTRKQFVDKYLFDVRPVHDENPFFHYYLRIKNVKEIYTIMGKKWQYFIEEGYILPAVFIQVLCLSIILIFLPVLSRRKTENSFLTSSPDRSIKFLPYFAFLGLGFIFVEIPLIQKVILPLEHPPYAIATALTSILISSGIGSIVSQRVSYMRSPFVLMYLSFLVVMYSILLPNISNALVSYPMPVKIFMIFLIITPLGIFMGIPFPLGLTVLSERNKTLIPWAWAINGCLSVLAPILAIMLAMIVGFKVVLWLGTSAYATAFIILRSFLRKSI